MTPEHLAGWIISYVVLLFSLSVHESAHGWMAYRMGDDTAVSQGRVTLNPLAHIDPIGTVLIPLAQMIYPSVGRFLLGWAKPTPVGAHNFRKLARGHILVAGAGPASNFLLTFLFTVALAIAIKAGVRAGESGPLFTILVTGIRTNVGLAVFNLVPLPPLDGSWIVSWGLPRGPAAFYDRFMEPYGQIVLIALYVTGILWIVVGPVVGLVLTAIEIFLGLV